MNPAIEITGLRKVFPGPIEALAGATLRVGAGEVVALVGPNGAGKTTLVEVLATIVVPTSGVARVGGVDVVRHPEAVRRLIGYAPAGAQAFYPRLTAIQNLEFYGALARLDRHAARARARELLALVDAEEVAERRVERISDGFRARLSLARAMVADPPVLFVDEPTRSLDPAAQEAVRALLTRLVRNGPRTILLVTHSLAEAAAVADRVAVLVDGRIVAAGDARALDEAGLRDLYFRSVAKAGQEEERTDPAVPEHAPVLTLSTPSRNTRDSMQTPASRVASGMNQARAFFLRDFRLDVGYKLSLALSVIDVLAGVASFFFLSRLIGARPGGFDAFGFILVGVTVNGAMTAALVCFAQAIREHQQTAALKAILAMPVSATRFVVLSSLYPLWRSGAEGAIYVACGAALGAAAIAAANLGTAAGLMILALAAFCAIGILSAAFTVRYKRGDPIPWLIGTTSWLLGGVFFPVDLLPSWLRSASAILPVAWALDGLRPVVLAGAPLRDVARPAIALALFTVAALPLSLVAFNHAVSRARRDGTLAHY